MTDAAPREGWYVTRCPDSGGLAVVYCDAEGQFWSAGAWQDLTPIDLPLGWTLGPRIDDLLHEAERYRNALIHAAIARERGDG